MHKGGESLLVQCPINTLFLFLGASLRIIKQQMSPWLMSPNTPPSAYRVHHLVRLTSSSGCDLHPFYWKNISSRMDFLLSSSQSSFSFQGIFQKFPGLVSRCSNNALQCFPKKEDFETDFLKVSWVGLQVF